MIIGFSTKPVGDGGAISWIKAFSKYCTSKGHEVKYNYNENIDVFCSVANFSKSKELEYLKKHRIKILQRVGAIFLDYNYDDKAIIEKGNAHLKQLISYADSIVYQSNFSKTVLFGSLYNGKEPNGDIIYNSTNKGIFHPNVKPIIAKTDKTIILSSAYWGTPKTALESIKLLVETARSLQNNPNIEFWVLGLAYKETENYVRKANLPNITKLNLLKPIPRNLVPHYIKASDLVLHLKAHEGCSNAVIETMNIGTPLVGLNSGSLPELLGDAALLANCTTNITKFPLVKTDDLIDKILTTLCKSDLYKKKMLNRARLFREENQFNQYLTILENLYETSH